MAKNEKNQPTALPVVSCEGCGVCCLHMGYPAFVLPREPLTAAEIEADENLKQQAKNPARREALLRGHPGESWWHKLPEDLKQELLTHMESWEQPDYDGTLASFDGPCIWLDTETRLCSHHEHRPNVCRDFDTGCQQCLDWRRVYADRIE